MGRIERFLAWVLLVLSVSTVLFTIFVAGAVADEFPPFEVEVTSVRLTFRIQDDPGGTINDYITVINWLYARDYRVEIAGECSSSCTLFTIMPGTCVVEGASLWFHAPFRRDLSTGTLIFDDEATKAITEEYPGAIQQWIEARGGLPQHPNWIVLKGQELYDLVPLCGAAVPTS